MREIRQSGSEGGAAQPNAPSLPLSQGTYEIFRKIDRYLKHGVASCWVVEPSLRTVKIIGADGTESVHHDGVITDPATGIEVDLDAVFS